MYTTNCFVRIAHPSMWSQIPFPLQLISNFRNSVAFGALFIFTIIEMCIAVWMIPNTPKDDYSCFENCASNIEYWVCCLLGISGWTLVLGTVYSVRFLQNPYGYCTSAPSHALLYVLSHSTHDKLSFEMFPIASSPHGLHGWHSPVQLPQQWTGRHSATHRRPSCIVVDLMRW